VTVRPETPADAAAIRAVNVAAFPTAAEADLVDRLRAEGALLVSLVAEDAGEVVGHVAFSPAALDACPAARIAALAPMAVVPSRQCGGVGSALARAGLDACRALGCGAAVVLGHPRYYPRFGFVPSVRFGFRSTYDVPDDVFLAQELVPGALAGATGVLRYHFAFAGV